MRIPQHVAIILDGNGRWAKSKGMPRNYGHTMGAKNVEVICEDAYHMGIQYLTLYAFSADKNNMRIRVIGDISRLDAKFRNTIRELEEATKKNTGLNLQIALNYGSRDEMIRAMKKMVKDHDAGKLATEDITEECFSSYLDTKEIPDPDLLIRTSGEQRLSNYLLWQLAYSEFYFTPVPWPDFSKAELEKAVEAYNQRDRRYGGVKEEA